MIEPRFNVLVCLDGANKAKLREWFSMMCFMTKSVCEQIDNSPELQYTGNDGFEATVENKRANKVVFRFRMVESVEAVIASVNQTLEAIDKLVIT